MFLRLENTHHTGKLSTMAERITEVQQGKAVLSVRQWSGKPYRSPQIEITRLTVKHGVDIQKVVLYGKPISSYKQWLKDVFNTKIPTK